MTLPPGVDAAPVQHASIARGVAFERGEMFFHRGEHGGEHLTLSFAAVVEMAEPGRSGSGLPFQH